MEKATLKTLLYHRFSECDARLLDYFFTHHAADTTLSYDEVIFGLMIRSQNKTLNQYERTTTKGHYRV